MTVLSVTHHSNVAGLCRRSRPLSLCLTSEYPRHKSEANLRQIRRVQICRTRTSSSRDTSSLNCRTHIAGTISRRLAPCITVKC
jgi:hypothetical protein